MEAISGKRTELGLFPNIATAMFETSTRRPRENGKESSEPSLSLQNGGVGLLVNFPLVGEIDRCDSIENSLISLIMYSIHLSPNVLN